jgi:hypothetical protein
LVYYHGSPKQKKKNSKPRIAAHSLALKMKMVHNRGSQKEITRTAAERHERLPNRAAISDEGDAAK